jgi:hypothetical protein
MILKSSRNKYPDDHVVLQILIYHCKSLPHT